MNGTITRASARAINRVLGSAFSGVSELDDVVRVCADAGVEYRIVGAASLAGTDKARHTREVTRSRKAQARRAERKAAAAAA